MNVFSLFMLKKKMGNFKFVPKIKKKGINGSKTYISLNKNV